MDVTAKEIRPLATTMIALAYDRSDFNAPARSVLTAARPHVGLLKVGLEAMTAFTPYGGTTATAVTRFWGPMNRLWDAKLHDIPNTVQAAVYNLTGGMSGITLHAAGGRKMLAAAAAGRNKKRAETDINLQPTILFGVTVLTSHSHEECFSVFGDNPGAKVLQFAQDCMECGIDGLVCSARELQLLRDAGLADSFTTLVPGIRPEWAAANDQARVMTPAEAARLGADYIVVGRPIWDGPFSASEAIRHIKDEIASA